MGVKWNIKQVLFSTSMLITLLTGYMHMTLLGGKFYIILLGGVVCTLVNWFLVMGFGIKKENLVKNIVVYLFLTVITYKIYKSIHVMNFTVGYLGVILSTYGLLISQEN